MNEQLLSRIEDAGLNASVPAQQRWLDGWLLRFSPGKAKRARCINAVANGRLPLDDRLRIALAAYDEARLPALIRVTPFTMPPGLDGELDARGWTACDDTRVMVRPPGSPPPAAAPLPAGLRWRELDASAFAAAIGGLRGSSDQQIESHAQRLLRSPVSFRGVGIERLADGIVLAGGQVTREDEIAGIYDVHTADDARGQGLATMLCEHLLTSYASHPEAVVYLQVDAGNHAARRIYERLGFADAYAYHYRERPFA